MYESHHSPLASPAVFRLRIAGHFAASGLLVVFSLGIGMAGYGYFEHLGARDAFLNAAMLLGGMGPVEMPTSPGGKLFAGFYALYAGLVFLVAVGVLLAPLLHRMLHQFHMTPRDEGEGASKGKKKS
jgi:hypothetical protein